MAQLARRHHTVPRFYLERFAESGQIGAASLASGRTMRLSITRAATENDFYMLSAEDGSLSDEFEQWLSKVEAEGARILRTVVDDRVWPLPEAQRRMFAQFVVLQLLRGPDHRRGMEQLQRLMIGADIALKGRQYLARRLQAIYGQPPGPEFLDRAWREATAPGGPPLRLPAYKHIKQMIDLMPEAMPYIVGRPWAIVELRRKRLLTSDTPVSLVENQPRPVEAGIGLMTAQAIVMPLDPTVGLLMLDPMPHADRGVTIGEIASGALDHRLEANTRLADALNRQMIASARLWLYHHPHDAALLPDPLPSADTEEFEVYAPDFVAMGEQMRRHGSRPEQS